MTPVKKSSPYSFVVAWGSGFSSPLTYTSTANMSVNCPDVKFNWPGRASDVSLWSCCWLGSAVIAVIVFEAWISCCHDSWTTFTFSIQLTAWITCPGPHFHKFLLSLWISSRLLLLSGSLEVKLSDILGCLLDEAMDEVFKLIFLFQSRKWSRSFTDFCDPDAAFMHVLLVSWLDTSSELKIDSSSLLSPHACSSRSSSWSLVGWVNLSVKVLLIH